MAEDIFFEHFDLLADTPGGVQKLRELILQLAVQGKLVPQDPNDPPASQLLKEVEVEKQRLVKEDKIKKQKPLPEIKPEEVPFDLPEGWEWVRLGSCIELISGQHLKPDEYHQKKEGIPYIPGPSDFGFESPNPKRWTIKEQGPVALKNDILITVKGSGVGKLNTLFCDKAFIGRQLMAIRSIVVQQQFIKMVLSNAYRRFQDKRIGIAIPGIGRTDILNFLLPLPPLSEQHRIVTKVDQFMTLCDELEAKKEKQKTSHARLNKSALQALRESKTNDEMEANWPRVKNNFRQLFTTPESVQELRSTILQLAVQGKLVPQNPQDEPASALLERIWEEKHRLFKEGKIKKQKPLPAIKPEEVPFELPEGWEWVRLGNLSQIKGGFAFKSSEYTNDGVRVVRISDFDETGFKDDSIIRYAFSEDLSGFKIEIKDILMAMTGGTVGKSLLVSGLPEPMVINQRVALIRMFDGIISEYIYSLIRTNLMQDAIQDIKNSTNDNISMRDITRFLVPLPPLPEQQRIVTKLDQLMALCDELESNLSKSQAEGEKLMAAVVEGISGNRQESDARLCNPTNQIPDEVASSTNHKLSDTAPANLQLANTAHPGPGPSTAGYSNPESDKSKSNNTAAAILAYMQPGEQYTRSDIMDALNLTVSAWNTGIRELKEQGVVVQTGEKRGARYGLSDRER